MRIANSNTISHNSISFQKRLIAKTNVLANGEQKDAYVYKLERDCDSDYFEKILSGTSSWHSGLLVWSAKREFEERNDDCFILEDNNKNCLGYIISYDYTDEYRNKSTIIRLLETVPMYSNRISSRKIKHIGKALIDFMKKYKYEKQGRELFISSPTISALDFYEKQGFNPNLYGCTMSDFNTKDLTKMEFVD